MSVKRQKRSRAESIGPNLFAAEFSRNGTDALQDGVFQREDVVIHFDRAEYLYPQWPSPTCIISDGPYGVSGFPGDEHQSDSLAEWYEPHIRA